MTTTIVILVLFSALLSSISPDRFQNRISEGQQGQQGQQQAPIANAGSDQRVNEGDAVVLNGTGSFDSDGEIISYAWGIEDSDDEAPPVSLNGKDTPVATFVAPAVAGGEVDSYLFELTVTDNKGLLGRDAVKVVVNKDIEGR